MTAVDLAVLALDWSCPLCGASQGCTCTNTNRRRLGRPRAVPHDERLALARPCRTCAAPLGVPCSPVHGGPR